MSCKVERDKTEIWHWGSLVWRLGYLHPVTSVKEPTLFLNWDKRGQYQTSLHSMAVSVLRNETIRCNPWLSGSQTPTQVQFYWMTFNMKIKEPYQYFQIDWHPGESRPCWGHVCSHCVSSRSHGSEYSSRGRLDSANLHWKIKPGWNLDNKTWRQIDEPNHTLYTSWLVLYDFLFCSEMCLFCQIKL